MAKQPTHANDRREGWIAKHHEHKAYLRRNSTEDSSEPYAASPDEEANEKFFQRKSQGVELSGLEIPIQLQKGVSVAMSADPKTQREMTTPKRRRTSKAPIQMCLDSENVRYNVKVGTSFVSSLLLLTSFKQRCDLNCGRRTVGAFREREPHHMDVTRRTKLIMRRKTIQEAEEYAACEESVHGGWKVFDAAVLLLVSCPPKLFSRYLHA